MKFVWLDHWYPDAWADWQATGGPWLHGTADFWDIALRAAGHESTTLIANADPDILGTALFQQPDILCVQNVGMWNPQLIRSRGIECPIVCFCSYAAEPQNLSEWVCVFSSFHWLVDELNQSGQRAEYLPLAFGRPVLERVTQPPERDLPLTFVGGLGSRIWKQGTETMAAVAAAFPEQFKWFGYRIEDVPEPLKKTYQGPAWGRKYFEILGRTKILINRHGEIACGFAQNMRVFEGSGMGCMVLNDCPGVLESALTYESADDAIWMIENGLPHWQQEAVLMRSETLGKHCYENRVPKFLSIVESL